MPKVYIINKSSHNFEAAEKYGKFVYMSEGPFNRYACNNMARQFGFHLENSHPDDWLLLCGLGVMNSIACAIFARRHGKLNLLLFKGGKYIERNLIIE
jgi:hypothetical protein